jgi:sodium-coupled monocarboxylate transporter 8/12
MIISVTLVVVKGVIDAEGLSNVWRINEEGGRLNLFKMDLDPFKRQSFYSYFFGAATYFSMSYCFDQQMIQVFYILF